MKKNKVLFGICMAVIAVSAAVCGLFSVYTHLKEPVYLPVYSVCDLQEDWDKEISFTVNYVANIEDEKDLMAVEFQNVPTLFRATSWRWGKVPVGRYHFYTYQVSVRPDEKLKRLPDLADLGEVTAVYQDGTRQKITGSRYLIKKVGGDRVMETATSSSSSDFSSWCDIVPKRGLILESVEVPLEEAARDRFSMTVDGVDYREIHDMELPEGKNVRIEAAFAPDRTIEERAAEIWTVPILHLRDEDGNTYEEPYYNAEKLAEPYNGSFWELARYLRKGGKR